MRCAAPFSSRVTGPGSCEPASQRARPGRGTWFHIKPGTATATRSAEGSHCGCGCGSRPSPVNPPRQGKQGEQGQLAAPIIRQRSSHAAWSFYCVLAHLVGTHQKLCPDGRGAGAPGRGGGGAARAAGAPGAEG